jgi:hypothetical protein
MHPEIIRQIAQEHARDLRVQAVQARAARRAGKARGR